MNDRTNAANADAPINESIIWAGIPDLNAGWNLAIRARSVIFGLNEEIISRIILWDFMKWILLSWKYTKLVNKIRLS